MWKLQLRSIGLVVLFFSSLPGILFNIRYLVGILKHLSRQDDSQDDIRMKNAYKPFALSTNEGSDNINHATKIGHGEREKTATIMPIDMTATFHTVQSYRAAYLHTLHHNECAYPTLQLPSQIRWTAWQGSTRRHHKMGETTQTPDHTPSRQQKSLDLVTLKIVLWWPPTAILNLKIYS